MITINRGDIFRSSCEAWVNPVNCRGVMGRGLALAFKARFPEMYWRYRRDCLEHLLEPGNAYLYNPDRGGFGAGWITGPRWIINATTKDDWRDPSTYGLVAGCLGAIHRLIDETKIRSVAMPALGCGNGGLDWFNVEQMIRDEFRDNQDLDLQVYPSRQDHSIVHYTDDTGSGCP